MVTEREIRCGLTGFLVGVFSTLVVVDYFRLEERWQRGLVLLGLAALIGAACLWLRRKAPNDKAEPFLEKEEVPSEGRKEHIWPSKAPVQSVLPAPRVPEPLQAEEKIYVPAVAVALSHKETEPEGMDTLQDWAAELPETAAGFNSFPEKLTAVWADYLSRGDGRFTADGLRRFLAEAGLNGEILTGEVLGAGEGLLAVDLGDGSGSLYLLPDFSKTVRSVARWFHAPYADSRLARITRLVEPAVVRQTADGLELKRQGVVE